MLSLTGRTMAIRFMTTLLTGVDVVPTLSKRAGAGNGALPETTQIAIGG
jgi:hypothetical protein